MRNFAKFVLSFIFIASLAMAAYPYDPFKIFTQADRDTAIGQINASKLNDGWKADNRSFVNLGSVITVEEASTISYADFKAKATAANATPYAFDYFAWCFRSKDANFITEYFKDATFNDPKACIRKFYGIPGRPEAIDVELNVFLQVVEDGLKQNDAAETLNKIGVFGQKTCRNYISRMNALPRENALFKLKELKRVIYKNISVSDDWKNLLVDLEIAIQSLQ